MKKRAILWLTVLMLAPICVQRHPGHSNLAAQQIGPSVALAQAQEAERDQVSGSMQAMQADPAAVERAKARSRFHYLMLGYGAIWLCLGVFLIDLTRKVGRVGSEIAELKARLEMTERGRRT